MLLFSLHHTIEWSEKDLLQSSIHFVTNGRRWKILECDCSLVTDTILLDIPKTVPDSIFRFLNPTIVPSVLDKLGRWYCLIILRNGKRKFVSCFTQIMGNLDKDDYFQFFYCTSLYRNIIVEMKTSITFENLHNSSIIQT